MATDEQRIRDLIATWHKSTNAGDVDAVLPLMADDVVFLVPGQAPMRGRTTFEQRLRGLLQANRLESEGDVVELEVSGDLAYCWTKLKVTITPLAGGTAAVRSGSALTVLRKRHDGSWVVIRDANLLSAAS
jgi:uncharacterized protein (TIGR02246 family)